MAESSNQGQTTRRQGRKLKPRSVTWNHFTRVKVTGDDGTEQEKAKCNHCGILYAIHGTTNQRNHLKECVGQESAGAAEQPCAPSSPSRPGLSADCREAEPGEEAKKHLARMIALRGFDPSVVEDDCFRSFVASLNPEFRVPSRLAIEEMCDGIFDEARRDSFSKLRRAPGRLSLAVGEARTMESWAVIYIACHFIDDQWNLHKVVVDALGDAGELYLVDTPILGVRMHSAGTDEVEAVISAHKDRLSLVACADNGVHNEVKDYIAGVNSDRDNLSCTTTTYVDNVFHSVARCLAPDPEFTNDMCEDIMDLHLTRQERLQLLSELGLDYGRAYREHWCACYHSLEVLGKRRFTKLVYADLFIKLLCKVWGQVYRGIQRISASTYPTSNLCLAELLKLREVLQHELARLGGDDDPDLKDRYEYFEEDDAENVLREASDKLDKAIQDSYLIWSVPLALDPRYKLRYIEFRFERAFGSEEAAKYVSEVRTKINELYNDYKQKYGTATAADHSHDANEMVATTSVGPLFEQDWIEHCRSQVNRSCLDRYLGDRPLVPPTEKDYYILNWWKVHSSEYPMVARMARDALAMPTCSKLSSDQLAQVRSILRGYSKKPYEHGTVLRHHKEVNGSFFM